MNINHAMIAAFERSKQPEEKRFTLRLFAIALMAVFFITLMATLAVGMQIYSKVASAQEQTDQAHLQSGFLAGVVHANDAAHAVKTAAGPEGDALVLVEALETGTYETRIYLYKGMLYQEYAIEGRDYNPANAVPLFATDHFAFKIEGQLVTVVTDEGTTQVALRSEQGGRP